jgi:hypothetical protein
MLVDRKQPGIHVTDNNRKDGQYRPTGAGGFKLEEPVYGTSEDVLRRLRPSGLLRAYRGAVEINRANREKREMTNRYLITQEKARPRFPDRGIVYAAEAVIQEGEAEQLGIHRLHLVTEFDAETIQDIQRRTRELRFSDAPTQGILGFVEIGEDPNGVVLGAVDTANRRYWELTIHHTDRMDANLEGADLTNPSLMDPKVMDRNVVFLNGKRLILAA